LFQRSRSLTVACWRRFCAVCFEARRSLPASSAESPRMAFAGKPVLFLDTVKVIPYYLLTA